MPLQIISPPGGPAVSLARAKEHLRADDAADDALITDMIAAATRRIERETGLALITSQWRLLADALPRDCTFRIPLAPVASIDEVAVRTESGWQTVPASDWRADLASRPTRLVASGEWPRPDGAPGAIRITFTSGFGATPDAVPEELRMAVLVLTAHYYEFREGGAAPKGLPPEVIALIAPWRNVAL